MATVVEGVDVAVCAADVAAGDEEEEGAGAEGGSKELVWVQWETVSPDCRLEYLELHDVCCQRMLSGESG